MTTDTHTPTPPPPGKWVPSWKREGAPPPAASPPPSSPANPPLSPTPPRRLAPMGPPTISNLTSGAQTPSRVSTSTVPTLSWAFPPPAVPVPELPHRPFPGDEAPTTTSLSTTTATTASASTTNPSAATRDRAAIALRLGYTAIWDVVEASAGRLQYRGMRIAEVPHTWQETQELIADGSEDALAQLARSPTVHAKYRSCREERTEQYATITDYLLHALFACPRLANAGHPQGKWVSDATRPDPEGKYRLRPGSDVAVRFIANEFPYHLEEGVVHDLIWATKVLSEEEIEQLVAQHLGADREVLRFRNHPALQSIPAVWHVHIIHRSRPTSSPTVMSEGWNSNET